MRDTVAAFQDGTMSNAWNRGKVRGSESWAASQAGKNQSGQGNSQSSETPATSAVSQNTDYDALMNKLGQAKGKGGSGGSHASNILDLNDKVSGSSKLQSSSGYTAAIRKLSPTQVNFSSARKLAAAVAVPLAMASVAPSAATDMSRETTGMEQGVSSVSPDRKNEGRTICIDRMCDQIVINIQNTDGKGMDAIRREVIKVFEEIYEV